MVLIATKLDCGESFREPVHARLLKPASTAAFRGPNPTASSAAIVRELAMEASIKRRYNRLVTQLNGRRLIRRATRLNV